jgi:hypothetical protein
MKRVSNSALDLPGRAEIGRGVAEGPHARRPAGQRKREEFYDDQNRDRVG